MAWARALRRLDRSLPALIVFGASCGAVWGATVRASWAALGRDQGIFQYVAWAVARGEVLYRDVRDVNGPVIAMVHLLFLHLGGADEHRFRVLDLTVTGMVFAFVGACVPSIVRAGPIRPEVRAAWALAGWAALSAQYLAYDFWDSAQRESFLGWFVAASIAIQAASPTKASPRRRAAAMFAAGALSVVPWFGKPTFALFTASQLLAIGLEREPLGARARRLSVFLAGGAAGASAPIAFLALRADAHAWARITFVDVPAMYRFIWPRPALTILSMPGYAETAALAGATTAGLLLLVARGHLPRRATALALMPVLGLASVLAQAKGFPYHFHPVTLGISLCWLVALAALWERAERARRDLARALVALVALALGWRAAHVAWSAPHPPAPARADRGARPLDGAARLAPFERVDFFPHALREAAAYVRAHTHADDRVQAYGMDPYVLFLAERRSATPYIYAYDLNVDAALHGSFEPGGPRPTGEQRARIEAMRDAHAGDAMARLERAPPAAFVFIDRSPLMTHARAFDDLASRSPEIAAWVSRHYGEAADFDGVHVWLRRPAPPR